MRFRPLGLAALALGLLAPQASAQTTAPPIAFDTFTLANGLKFVVHEDHSTPVVAINVWYDVGSAHEQEGRSGFAHLFEHMLFQETENLEKGEFDAYIKGAGGGNINGTTNTDRTMYFETLPSNRLNLALWLEAERMANLRVTADNFARETEVVKEERRKRVDNQPYGEAILTADTMSMVWEPYRHTVFGTMEDLDAATAEDVVTFYERYYVPNNATIAVAGDVTTERVRELAEEYFGDVPRGPETPALPPMPAEPRLGGEKRKVLESASATLPLFLANYVIPPHSAPDSYPLQLLSSIFSEGESSRLYRRLVKEEQAALEAFSFLDSRLGPGRFMIGGLPNQGVSIDRIQELLEEEIAKLQEEGVTDRELQKAKNQARANLIMGRQSVLSKSSELQHYRLLHGDIGAINTELERIMGVTVDDIRDVARKYLVPDNRATVIVQPVQRSAT